MNELKVSLNGAGEQVVSARDLHAFLEVGTEFPKWCVRMFEYGFEANKDYVEVIVKNDRNSKGGRSTLIDYAFTLNTAKEISMIQRTPKGKQAREYFISCEKELVEFKKASNSSNALEQLIGLKKHYDRAMLNTPKIPHTHFAMIGEMPLRVFLPLLQKGFDLKEDCLPDGSLGKGFVAYLSEQGVDMSKIEKYNYTNLKGQTFQANMYPNEFYHYLQSYVHDIWLHTKGAKYFNQNQKLK